MKTKELRLGNYVNFNDPEAKHATLQIVRGLTGVKMKHFTPVPLNEYWFDKLGFKYNEGFADSYEIDGFEIYGNPFKIGYQLESIHGHQLNPNLVKIMNSITPIEYVHQLQNLYFALTGKELTT